MTKKTTRETSQAVERRPGQILERHDMAEDSTWQGNLEMACWGLRPTTGHNGYLMMMTMIMMTLQRFSNLSAASGRQRCFASCVSVDFLRLQSSTLKVLRPLGLDRRCRLIGVIPAWSTGTGLFCRQGVGGLGTDPQMPAVPWIVSAACFHLKGLRPNCPLYPGLSPFRPLSVLAAYELCCLHEVSSRLRAWMVQWALAGSLSDQPLAKGQCIQVSTWLRQWASLILFAFQIVSGLG